MEIKERSHWQVLGMCCELPRGSGVLIRDRWCQQLISKTQRAIFDFEHENFMGNLNRSFLRPVSRRLQNCELEQ